MKTIQLLKILTISSALILGTGLVQAKPAKGKKGKNLVTNGDFSRSKLKMWLVGITTKYGQDLDHKVSKKSIHFKEIKQMKPKYVTLGQYLDIKKGKKYQVSFETKTSADLRGRFNFNIGRPGFARFNKKVDYDHTRGKIAFSTDWKETKINFEGEYNTDNKNYAGRKVKGKDEKKVWELLDKKTGREIGPTWIVFNLGGVEGDVYIRNVVVRELPKDAADANAEDANGDKEAKELSKEEKKAARKAERERKKKEREQKRKQKNKK